MLPKSIFIYTCRLFEFSKQFKAWFARKQNLYVTTCALLLVVSCPKLFEVQWYNSLLSVNKPFGLMGNVVPVLLYSIIHSPATIICCHGNNLLYMCTARTHLRDQCLGNLNFTTPYCCLVFGFDCMKIWGLVYCQMFLGIWIIVTESSTTHFWLPNLVLTQIIRTKIPKTN